MEKIHILKSKSIDLKNQIEKLMRFLSSGPEGSLVVRKNASGNNAFYHLKKDGESRKETYIKKDNRNLAAQLAAKEYAAAQLKDLEEEKKLVDHEIRSLTREKAADRYLLLHPAKAELVLPMLSTGLDDYAKKWAEESYVRSNRNPEHLIYPTIIPDLMVRSKSEGDIAACLVHNQVPLRYEAALDINGYVLHPDFTCLNPRTREIFYIEHQGKWDDPGYLEDVQWREKIYQQAGIYPWKNLLITTETKDQPFDINWFQTIVDYYLK